MDVTMMVVARVSNRIFTGLPLCRNKRFLELNVDFTIKAVISALMINLFPKFLKPCVIPRPDTIFRSRCKFKARGHVFDAAAEGHQGDHVSDLPRD
jgi:hypothetical protein